MIIFLSEDNVVTGYHETLTSETIGDYPFKFVEVESIDPIILTLADNQRALYNEGTGTFSVTEVEIVEPPKTKEQLDIEALQAAMLDMMDMLMNP